MVVVVYEVVVWLNLNPSQYGVMIMWFVTRVSDFNLDEEEVLKLASLGKEANNKETIDVLKKSLVIRNK